MADVRQRMAGRPPPWRDERVLRLAVQVVFTIGVGALLWYLGTSLISNMRAQGMRTDLGFLDQSAGFRISGSDFNPRDSIWQALLTAFGNTLTVAVWALLLASLLGLIVGIARLSENFIVNKAAAAFVEGLRNVPLIIFLIFLYLAVLAQLPQIDEPFERAGFVLSNRGLNLPWFSLAPGGADFGLVVLVAGLAAAAVIVWRTRLFVRTGASHHRVLWGVGVFGLIAVPGWALTGRALGLSLPVRDGRVVTGGTELTLEYGALMLGLALYMATFIAEIIRGSILAVPKGQSEAANALGLSGGQRYRHVVLPQALRIAVPPVGNEYINLAKNTALGVGIAFPELLRVTRIAIGQATPAPQMIGIMALFYLTLSLVLSILVNIVNRRLALRGT